MKYVLAPLAGFTDAPFRRLCFEGGADLTYTEMVSAAGLAHGSSPTCHLMETMPGEGPVALQLFGSKECDLAYAARFVETFQTSRAIRFAEVNLNAGCPMTKVTREGAGAKLIEDPAKIHRLLKAMAENTSLPVTLKTRLGPHPQKTNVLEILDAAEQAGAKGLVVHARYTSQMHGGPTHLDTLADVVRRAHVPVTGNGSVVDAKTAAAMAATGVDAIMIGRAALPRPAIFNDLKSQTTQTTQAFQTFQTHLRHLLEFRDILARKYPNDHIPSPDAFASVKMHVHLFRYFNGRPGAAELRKRLNTVRSLAQIFDIIRPMKAICLFAALSATFVASAVEWKNLDADHHLGGRKTSAGYLQGKVVLVDRWGAKCPPCRALLPRVEETWKGFKKKQFVVLGGHCAGWGAADEVKKLIADNKLTYPVYEDAGLAVGEPSYDAIPFLYVVDETGKIVYRGHDEKAATEALVIALTDLEAPKDVAQWKRFLDYELEHLPAHAYIRLNEFRKKHPKEAKAYVEKARELMKIADVKKVADLVEFAKKAKDPPRFGPKDKAKQKKYESLVKGVYDKCASLKDVADPRLQQEAKNSLADLAWAKASF